MQRIEFGRLVIDLGREGLLRDGDRVKLRPRSFPVLHYLVEMAGGGDEAGAH